MIIYLRNNTRKACIVQINDGEIITVNPFEYKSFENIEGDNVRIYICQKNGSHFQKKEGLYNLVIESTMQFTGIKDGEIFNISREKIRFCLDCFYDRFFITSESAICIAENHKISDENRIKKKYKRNRFISECLIDPLISLALESIFYFIPIIIIIIIIISLFGWMGLLIITSIFFIFMMLINMIAVFIGERFFGYLSNKIFKDLYGKKEFYSYFDNKFIVSYYSNKSRTPFFGEVEIN